ncbi:MAG: hypothetical protein ACO1PB_04825 [Ramlibacter sp.]
MAELLENLKRWDARRPGVPGEHWATFAAGLGLWVATRRQSSLPLRILAGVAGGMLVARAARGRKTPDPLQAAVPRP